MNAESFEITDQPLISEHTEIGRAERFIQAVQETHKYVSQTKEWHVCENGVWAKTDEKRVLDQAIDFIKNEAYRISDINDDATRTEASQDYRRYANCAGITNITRLAAVRLLADVDDFDADDNALCVKNGWIDLTTNAIRQPSSEKQFSLCCDAKFNSTAPSELWRKTVLQVFNGDRELAEYFQKAAGYSLLGDNKEQVMFICYGAGANGKSVLLETIRSVLGTYGQNIPVNALMNVKSSSGNANPEIARLRNIRFALASETEKGQRWSANRIKLLTGGDTIATRALYKDITEFKAKATIWVACNHKPEVDAADKAMWRRMRLIPFARIFTHEEQDPDLTKKLQNETDGILSWMLQGLAMYRSHGLKPPQSVIDATDNYRNEMDSVKRFIESQVTSDHSERSRISVVKDAYRNWCRDEGIQALAASQFNAALEDHGYRQIKSGSSRYWQGLKLEDEIERAFRLDVA